MIETKNLSFHYTPKQKIIFPNFALQQGEHCLLLGESGSGKTTLLHTLGGLLRNYTGGLKMLGAELRSYSENKLDDFRAQNIGFIFQRNHLITALSVEKNLQLAPYLAGKKADKERVMQILTRLGIAEKKTSKVTEISQGQAQRVAIARAVVNSPKIILADEPTSALDDKHCENVITLLLDVATETNATLIVATHDQRIKNKISKHVQLTTNFQS
jgi:ABC-type lipoprotein export system ATPase subunit